MSGPATFSGTTYQAKVAAYISVHVLTQMRLGWFSPADDTPIALAAETGGPGDDVSIEFGQKLSPAEAQAKHGLAGKTKALEVFQTIRDNAPGDKTSDVAVVVDRSSSKSIYIELARDLERIRSGVVDGLKPDTKCVVDGLKGDMALLRRIRIVALDLDNVNDAERKSVIVLLGSVLEDPSKADQAWAALVADAGDVAARRLRRTRLDLVQILGRAGIVVRPPAADDRWHRQLDFIREVIKRRYSQSAFVALAQLEADIGSVKAEPRVWYRLWQMRAACEIQMGKAAEALRSARRSIDFDPQGVRALATAATAAMILGQLDEARHFIDRAIEADPADANAWGIEAGVADAEGRAARQPTAAIAESQEYRRILAHLAIERGDFATAARLSAKLISDGDREPDLLMLRANSLLATTRSASDAAAKERLLEAERLASDLLESLHDDSHPFTAKGYLLRSEARSRLGDSDGAEKDLASARESNPGDLDVLRRSAIAAVDANNEDIALPFLRHPSVDGDALLLGMRAHLLAGAGDEDGARRDVAKALLLLADAPDPHEARIALVDAALALKDSGLGLQLLGGITDDDDVRVAVLSGGHAFLRGEVDAGIAHYRRAIAVMPTDAAALLADLGLHLMKAKDFPRAAAVFTEVGLEKLPARARNAYGVALVRTNNLVEAQRLIDHIAATEPLPEWALQLATDLALKQEDIDKAISHLTALVARPGAEPQERIELARRLVERGRITDAQPHLDLLMQSTDLSPVRQMQTAQLLFLSGRESEALEVGFKAFRKGQQDPQLHRALISLALRSRVPVVTPGEVGPDTHVRLRQEGGVTRAVTIYPEPPVDPIRDELTVAEANAAGLIGKKVGDVVSQGPGWNPKSWVVEEILDATVHAVRDAMLHYEDRFPTEPFFMTGFNIGDGKSVKDFMPLLASLESRKTGVTNAFKMYGEQVFPLGFVVTMIGGNIPDVMRHLSSDSSGPALVVEWADDAGQGQSRASATAATTVVLTRSAFETAYNLGLLDALAATYALKSPRSLIESIRSELDEAMEAIARGKNVVMSEGGGLRTHEISAGHESLVAAHARLASLLAWLEKHSEVEPRPLGTIEPAGSREEQLRDLVGSDSYDALMLTKHYRAALYADDLGLRKMMTTDTGKESFSTVALVAALADRGVITPAERNAALQSLIERRYAFVRPTKELLDAAISESARRGPAKTRQVFALLGGPVLTADDAARLLVQTLRSAAVASLQVLSLGEITGLGLEAMSAAWPRKLIATLVQRIAAAELRFLPAQLDEVTEACIAFVKPFGS